MELERADVMKLLISARTVYPVKEATKEELKAKVNVYYEVLRTYPGEVVGAAFWNAVKVCKFFPTPAEIVEQADLLLDAAAKSESELFAELRSAIATTAELVGQFNYTFRTFRLGGKTQGEIAREKVREVYENLDPILKEYLGGTSALISLARSDETQLDFERARFSRAYPASKKRVQIKTEFPQLAQLADGALKSLEGGDDRSKV